MSFLKTKKNPRHTILLPIILSISLLIGISGNFAFAETSSESTDEIVVKASPQIQKNPLLMKILKQLEIQKLQFAQLKNDQGKTTETQKILDEKRIIAKQRLDEELERMNKKYEDQTPRAAFSKFVSKMPEKVHNVYWGMFDFQDKKVKSAQKAMQEVIKTGGSMQEARQAFYDEAAMKRVQLIEVTKNLNIKYGLADDLVQVTFDEYGKLPRTDN